MRGATFQIDFEIVVWLWPMAGEWVEDLDIARTLSQSRPCRKVQSRAAPDSGLQKMQLRRSQ